MDAWRCPWLAAALEDGSNPFRLARSHWGGSSMFLSGRESHWRHRQQAALAAMFFAANPYHLLLIYYSGVIRGATRQRILPATAVG